MQRIALVIMLLLGVGMAFGGDYEIVGTNELGVVSINISGSSDARITETFTAPEVSKLAISRGAHKDVCYLAPTGGENTFTGGVEITNCQLRYDGPSVKACFGDGPIAFVDKVGAFFAMANADVPNRLEVLPGVWVASDGKCRLTLRDIGFAGDNTSHIIGLGRANAKGVSINVLSITNDNCEAIGQVCLRGQIDLTIENRIPVGGQCANLFEQYALHPDGSADVHVSNRGVVFEVPEGVDVAVGVPLRADHGLVATNVMQVVEPYNASFEEGNSGWEISADVNGNNPPGVLASPHSSWCTFVTPYGGKVMMMRWGNKFSTSSAHPVYLPEAGEWRVVFVCASRNVNGTGGLNPITVTIDPDSAYAQSATIPARATDKHDYIEVAAEPMELAAGPHHLQFVTGSAQQGNSGIAFDAIRLERIVTEAVPDGVIAKTGAGKLTMSGLTTTGVLDVREGTLTVDVAELTNAMTVCVAAGANLRLTDEGIGNLIANGSFQQDGDNIANLTPMQISGWTSTITHPRGVVNSGGNGLQGNGGNCSTVEPWTTYGKVTAFMRESTALTQTIEVPEDGEYMLTFIEAHRKSYDDAQKIPYTVRIGDVLVFTGHPTSSAKFTRHSVSVALTKGEYELEVHFGDDSLAEPAGRQGALVYFDDFRLSPAAATRQPRRANMEFESGSGLILDNAFPCVLDKVLVDGKEVRAKPNRIAIAGVSVQGEGVVVPLQQVGLLILVR